jgi:hypothetical protein
MLGCLFVVIHPVLVCDMLLSALDLNIIICVLDMMLPPPVNLLEDFDKSFLPPRCFPTRWLTSSSGAVPGRSKPSNALPGPGAVLGLSSRPLFDIGAVWKPHA